MSLNILTADGLQRIGGVTKEEIITALEYTPANSEVESTVETHVADADAHISAEERSAWNAKSDFSGNFYDLEGAPDIAEDGSGELHIADNDGNIIARVDAGGIHTTEVEANGVMLGQAVTEHIADTGRHITDDERIAWNAKSDFSGAYEDLTGQPSIAEDGSKDLKIADESGNIIAQFDSGGLTTTTVSATSIIVNGADVMPTVDEHISDSFAHVSEEDRTAWDNKVDKEDGKGLSSNDFTNEEKAKLAMISDEIASASIDDAMSETSTNPVQNKVVNAAINAVNGVVEDHISDTSVHITVAERVAWNNKSDFSGAFSDLKDAPNIAEDNAGNMVIADENGNVIFRADAGGIETTTVTATEVVIKNEKIGEAVIAHGAAIDENKSNIDLIQDSVDSISELVGNKPVSEQISDAMDGFKGFSGDYNDLENAPNINNVDDKELFVADNSGNVILRVNENGVHSVGMYINGTDVAGLIDSKIDAAVHDIPTAVFSNVKVGSTTITADSINDTLTLEAGSNITLTPDANGDKVTIAATNATYSNATTSKAGLMSTTDKAKLNATNIAYGTCSTAAGTAAKVITVSGNTNWTLGAGSMITVLFSATNTAQNPTFNVNGTGAKNVYYTSSKITTGNLSYAGYANRPMNFMYDGTQYRFISWGVDNNSDTKVTQAAAITTAGEYPVILGYSTDTSAVTNTVNKASTLTYNPSTKVLTTTTFKGSLNGTANAAKKLNTNAGSSTKPVYFRNGIPVETSYKTETWTFELDDGSTVSKTVVVC